jgi:hypothetical protein
MLKYIPLPRGYGNPVFKDYSVREYQTTETRLFDLYNKSPLISTLPNSIIELRELQVFIIETMGFMSSPFATNDLCAVIHQAFEYHMACMDPSDAANLRLKSSMLLDSKDLVSMYKEMEVAKVNISTLININLAVMKSFLMRQDRFVL